MWVWVSVLMVRWERKDKLCVDEGILRECGSRVYVDSGGGELNMIDFEFGLLFTDVRVGKGEF